MRNLITYQRAFARSYALQWALGRNPSFYDYSRLGGDCTNFVSQTLYAGGSLMNYQPMFGWFYLDANQKSPSWTGVEFLYQFLISRSRTGPLAEEVEPEQAQVGDLVQIDLRNPGQFDHTAVITEIKPGGQLENIFISAHSRDLRNVALTKAYSWNSLRFLHILGSQP